MRISRLALGAGLLGFSVLAFAAPASAAGEGTDTEQARFTSQHNGEDAECTVEGGIEAVYDAEHDKTDVRAFNHLNSGDAGCLANIIRTSVEVTWRREEDGPAERTRAFATDSGLETTTSIEGRLASISAHHDWAYLCDASPDDACDVSLTTTPK